MAFAPAGHIPWCLLQPDIYNGVCSISRDTGWVLMRRFRLVFGTVCRGEIFELLIGAEELSRINSSPARAVGEVVWGRLN